MDLFFIFLKFIIYAMLIVIISKYLLSTVLRKLSLALNLKPRAIGNITGISTSIPEFLTVTFSSFAGLNNASIYNVLSSNIINLIQYIGTVILNKNTKIFSIKPIKIDLVLIVLTIIIPIIVIKANIALSLLIAPIFIFLFVLFYFINRNVHRLYFKKEDNLLNKQIVDEENKILKSKSRIAIYIIIIALIGVILFVIGNRLGNILNNLCNKFNVSEIFIGCLLGLVTSIPELITFFESQKYHKKDNNSKLGVIEATNNLLTSNALNLFIIQTIAICISGFLLYNR